MTTATSAKENPIAYLGPEGSFAHVVARKRFGNEGFNLVPFPSVDEVFDYLEESSGSVGVVPIENSSGGIITATVDRIVGEGSPFHIREEISLNIKLALLGREGDNVTRIYSHFAPFHHCDKWLKRTYPDAQRVTTPSTSNAVINATEERGAAAIGLRDNAERYHLDVLHFPIEAEVPNVTQFFVIGQEANLESPENSRTSLAVELCDFSGSLYQFLEPFAKAEVNLTRIESRPIVGHPGNYRFYIEIEGTDSVPEIRHALEQADSLSSQIRNLGSYPASSRFDS